MERTKEIERAEERKKDPHMSGIDECCLRDDKWLLSR